MQQCIICTAYPPFLFWDNLSWTPVFGTPAPVQPINLLIRWPYVGQVLLFLACYATYRSVGNKPHFIMRQLLLGQMTSDQIRTPLSFPVVDQTWHSEAPRMPVISTNPKTVHSTSVSAPINWATLIHHLIWKFARFSIKLVFEVNDRKQGVCGIGESGLEWFIHLATNQLLPIMFQLTDAFRGFTQLFNNLYGNEDDVGDHWILWVVDLNVENLKLELWAGLKSNCPGQKRYLWPFSPQKSQLPSNDMGWQFIFDRGEGGVYPWKFSSNIF